MFAFKNVRYYKTLQGLQKNATIHQRVLYSTKGITMEYERDPQPLFTDPETQRLLQSMTQLQVSKIFRKTTVPDNSIDYKFLTTEQLEREFRETLSRARKRLQMPPVVQVKSDENRVISRDPALKGFSDTKYVCTDISYGLRQSERKVVVRQTDGTLEYAPMETVKRMHQLYVPLPGRKLRKPRMFEDEHLKRCLDEQKYEFILNRLTIQYEPYERDFHDISSRVYQHINETKQFDALRSTRHFGPMAFFYAWHRCIDDLLYDMIQRDYLKNAVELIVLMYKIHKIPTEYSQLLQNLEKIYSGRDAAFENFRNSLKTNSNNIHDEIKTAIGKTSEDFQADELCLTFVEDYINQHAVKKVQLELAVQTLKEINTEKRQLYDGLSKAHGIQ